MANASLFAQYSRPVRSVADYTADMDATEANALKLATGRRAVAQADAAAAAAQRSQNKLAQIAAMSATEDDFLAGLDRSGEEGLMKLAQDRRKASADVGKTAAETTAKTADARKTTAEAGAMERLRAIQRITSFERPDVVPGLVQSMVQSGEIEPAEADAMLKSMPADPAGFERWKYALIQGAAKPDVIVKERGDTERNAATNATSIATNRLTNETSRANNQATVGAQYANANAVRETANATRDAAKITARAGDETGLRKEFADLPEVKKYKNAIPAYQSIVESSKTNNPQADINLIYGLAKLYDPDSVVREGEYGTIANSQAIPEWIKGQAQRLVGGGRLTEETKKQIREQAKIRADAYKSEYDGAKKSFDGIATGRGLNPANVFPAVGDQLATSAAPVQTATNPQTGQKVQLVNGQWVPVK